MSDVRIDVDLSFPATMVWRAATERQLLGAWFMPTDLLAVPGGTYRAFPPAGLPGFAAPFDIDVLEVVGEQRLRMLWRGERMHSEVLWELSECGGGCRLAVTQSGFLGLSGQQRRADLLEAYESLFRQRLPEVLRTIAGRLGLSTEVTAVDEDPKRPWWKRLADIPADRRTRLLSVIGAMVLTGLVAAAIAVMVSRAPVLPAVIELPKDAQVTSAWDGVSFAQERRRVVFTPGDAHRELAAGSSFTFSFQVGDPSETGRPNSCAVNGRACQIIG